MPAWSGVSEQVVRQVGGALGRAAGGPVLVRSVAPVREGWSAGHGAYPWITRCAVPGPPGWDVTSVIVKAARPADHWRAGNPTREPDALRLLDHLGSDAGPKVMAYDDALGLTVLTSATQATTQPAAASTSDTRG